MSKQLSRLVSLLCLGGVTAISSATYAAPSNNLDHVLNELTRQHNSA